MTANFMENSFQRILPLCICLVAAGCAQKVAIATNDQLANAQPPVKEEMRSGIITYEGVVFGLTPPQGWLLDAESGIGNGVPVVFYPEGSSWETAKVVMYANVTVKHDGETVDSLVRQDMARFKNDDNSVVISDMQPIAIGKKQAMVKSFYGKSPENYEAVAYIDEKQHVVFLVLSAKSMHMFESSLPQFSNLVSSYFYMGSNGTD